MPQAIEPSGLPAVRLRWFFSHHTLTQRSSSTSENLLNFGSPIQLELTPFSYHANFGGPGVDLETGAHSNKPYMQDDGSGLYAFSVEYSWRTNALRKLTPKSNTFCAAGAFFPDGTMLNVAGAETYGGNVDVSKLLDGRQALRRYAPGPCSGGQCTMDYDVDNEGLQSRRWYPTSITLTNGDILIVGGSDVGLLVTNEANINNPTYELIKADGSAAPAQQELEILKITEAENQQAGKSFNLYPICKLDTPNHLEMRCSDLPCSAIAPK